MGEDMKLDAARKLVAAHEEKELRKCNAEIERVLAKYGFKLVTNTQILLTRTGGGQNVKA